MDYLLKPVDIDELRGGSGEQIIAARTIRDYEDILPEPVFWA
ncbi:MAG TPA: hypothetical protein VI233_00810 [Puia sp.]